MWKYGTCLVCGLGMVLLVAQPAAANMGPTYIIAGLLPGSVLLIMLLLLLSAVGGAYPILLHLDPNRNRGSRIAVRWMQAIAIVVSTLFMAADFSFLIVGLVGLAWLLYLWLWRCIQMLWWAKQAWGSTPRPPHLATANPWRLGLAGVTLIVLPVLAVYAADPFERERVERESRRIRITRSDTKTAATQAIVYANDKNAYPTSLKVLRDSGYANVRDEDPWGRPFVFAPLLTEGRKPKSEEDVYIYSKGSCGTGTYQPGRQDTGKCGAVGYSSIYGSFKGTE
jgi:hypothetical protein